MRQTRQRREDTRQQRGYYPGMAPTIPGNVPANVSDPAVIRRVLTTPATWAVVGLSTDATRTAYGVARWMREGLGHRIIPVHPRAVGVWGEPCHRTLTQIPDGTAVAVVDCFVNSTRVGAVVDEAIANKDRLGIETLWLQLGVIDQDAARRAIDAGLDVVMDTCPMIEYPKL
jgi:predicted CoA-binding protein